MTYWLYRAIALLPLPVKYGLSATAAFLLRHVFRYRAKVIDTNLRNAFPERDAEWRRYTAARFYRQFTDVTMEIVHASRMNLADFKRRVTVEGIDELDRLTENRTRSVIVLTIHLGNWEWMMHAANAHGDIPIDPVYRRLHNAGSDRFAYEVRSRFGGEPILMEKVARNVLKHRRRFRASATRCRSDTTAAPVANPHRSADDSSRSPFHTRQPGRLSVRRAPDPLRTPLHHETTEAARRDQLR